MNLRLLWLSLLLPTLAGCGGQPTPPEGKTAEQTVAKRASYTTLLVF